MFSRSTVLTDSSADDGSMKKDEREKSFDAIREKKPVKTILVSFKAGGIGLYFLFPRIGSFSVFLTGLNLTACNNVILIDLWWNPALEVCADNLFY